MAYTKKEFLGIVQQVRNHHAGRRLDQTISAAERERSEAIFQGCSKDLEDRIPEAIANPGKPIGPG